MLFKVIVILNMGFIKNLVFVKYLVELGFLYAIVAQ